MSDTAEYDFQPRELAPAETLRHSMAHLMASAVEELYPGTQFGIGPHIDHGFYYDMEVPETISEDDLATIETKMRKIAKKNLKFEHSAMSREEALAWADSTGQPYKRELIEGFDDEVISFYTHGEFTDMCAGPHVNYSKKIKHFKLTRVAGAYWRGDENNKMLTRIYGVGFETRDELDAHLEMLEEAKKRDHRRLGKDLQLFRITPDYGGGLVLWLPNGAYIRRQIEDFWRETHLSRGYDLLFTPHLAPRALWDKSGHTSHYSDSMYSPMQVEDETYQLKPMNCPFHVGAYNATKRSYRDLPIRYAELGTVYRYERSGTLHGLMRVRGFTQDDAHIFCTAETLEAELDACLDIAQLMYDTFGFPEYKVELSVRDSEDTSKYLGSDDIWDLSQTTLAKVLDDRNIEYTTIEGEAAFYGPKIDVKVVDAIGRTWQLTTIQLDFNLPDRFDLEFIGSDNQPHQPIMIHRALLGSLERFFGILIEHYAGNFPVWMAPTQVRVLPLSDKFLDYANTVTDSLKSAGIRAVLDDDSEKLGYRIRRAEMDKIPYVAVVGGREEEAGTVGVRKRLQGDLGAMPIADFAARVSEESAQKSR
ncbi:MAG: threonine--tRNA ligase [Myxococcota bacterium]|nr:threonine--tRNA ligase [Myxococcota bacterium]